MIRRYKLGRDVELHKRTLERGLLSLVGPDARRRRRRAEDLPATEHAHRAGELGGRAGAADRHRPRRRRAVRRGRHRARRRRARRARARVRVGEAAAEVRRVESGRPRYGVDLDDTRDPAGGGAQRARGVVQKGCYVGQETVARLYFRGKPNRHLRGLRLSAPGRARRRRCGSASARSGGSARSSTRRVHGPIALALVRREAAPGEHARRRRRRRARARSWTSRSRRRKLSSYEPQEEGLNGRARARRRHRHRHLGRPAGRPARARAKRLGAGRLHCS